MVRVEQIGVNNLTFAKTSLGEQTTTETLWFNTRAQSENPRGNQKIQEHYRQYDDVAHLMVNYTPNIKTVIDNTHAHSITYRAKSWRIDNVYEHPDRQFVTITCYRNDPATAV
jgi:hypothetical protein